MHWERDSKLGILQGDECLGVTFLLKGGEYPVANLSKWGGSFLLVSLQTQEGALAHPFVCVGFLEGFWDLLVWSLKGKPSRKPASLGATFETSPSYISATSDG